MGVSSPTNTVALAKPTRPARFHVSASHRPPTTCHPSPESVHYPSKPRNPIPNAPRLPRPPPLAASSMSPLPPVRPLPAIPILTSHPFAFTLSNLTAHFSSLTPLAPVIPAQCLPRACRGAGTQRHPTTRPLPATPTSPAHRAHSPIPPIPAGSPSPSFQTHFGRDPTRPKIARKAPRCTSRVF